MTTDHKEAADSAQMLREVTAATLRALACEGELEVAFVAGNETQQAAQHTAQQLSTGGITMPQVPERQPHLGEFRGRADRHAFWLRHHDSSLAPALSRPEARALWFQLEQVRVGLVATRVLDGCRANLTDCLRRDLQRESLTDVAGPPPVAAAALLQQALASNDSSNVASNSTSHRFDLRAHSPLWIERLTPLMRDLAGLVEECLDDQPAFSQQVLRLLNKLDLLPPPSPGEDDAGEQEASPDAGSADDAGAEQMLPPEPGEDSEMWQEAGQETLTMPMDMEGAQEEAGEEDAAAEEQGTWLERHLAAEGSGYQVYCRDFDRIVGPEDICPSSDLRAWRAQLDQLAQPYRAIVNKLANRLGRLIAAQQTRRWHHDLEEGLLDSQRLHRIIARPLAIPPYKQEHRQDFPDTAVSLLIDNSGSQRGKAIALAAVTAEIVAATLERCNVRTEILGFTTSAWRGGSSRKQWMQAQRPVQPGRLNDLLHILYKSAGMPWRRARRNMGLMLMPDLLKENIDGEALIWAHDRLMSLPEERRILMVISDGAPVDDSTLSANDPGYLDIHLREVVAAIEKHRMVELTAIGIGHDVSRYYSRALTLHRVEDLGPAVLNQLAELFARPQNASLPSRRRGF